MRATYLVCYDISDDKRLRKVFQTCRDFGNHLQYSVFECDLNAAEKVQFEHLLAQIIKHDEDQVLFVLLGPAEGRGERVISALGKPYTRLDAPCYVYGWTRAAGWRAKAERRSPPQNPLKEKQ
jgi:CRISPR-associated protein Cas2